MTASANQLNNPDLPLFNTLEYDLKIEELKTIIKQMIKKKSFKQDYVNKFTLASGKKSAFYFNIKSTILTPEGGDLVAKLFILKFIEKYNIQAVGGLESGAIPVISQISAISLNFGKKPVKGFYVKKKTKEHGDKNLIEGALKPSDKDLNIMVVDDVITEGGSISKAIEVLRDNGYKKGS